MKTRTFISSLIILLLLGACGKNNPNSDNPNANEGRKDTLPSKVEKEWQQMPELEIDEKGQADLISYGVPAKIKAPKGLKVSQMGKVVPSLTLRDRDRDGFWISVETNEMFYSFDRKKIKERVLEDVKKLSNFSKIVEDEDFGFIFELDFNGEKQYNFRYIITSNQLYHVFRTTVMNKVSLEKAKELYEISKNQENHATTESK